MLSVTARSCSWITGDAGIGGRPLQIAIDQVVVVGHRPVAPACPAVGLADDHPASGSKYPRPELPSVAMHPHLDAPAVVIVDRHEHAAAAAERNRRRRMSSPACAKMVMRIWS